MASNYGNMAVYFKSDPGWEHVRSPTYEWVVPNDLLSLIPAAEMGKPYTTRGHQQVDDPISMAFIQPGPLLAEVGSWFKQADLINEQLQPMRAANKELRPAIMPMRGDELLFVPEHGKDPCWALALSSRAVLTRRTVLREHTRVVPWHFTLPGGAKANKIYAYHAMAFAAAYINTIHSLEHPNLPALFDLDYSLEDIQSVTKGKKDSSNVLCHGCGNAFCCNPWHLKVATKSSNDEEEFCHHFLRKMSNLDGYSSFVENVCKMHHVQDPSKPCWTNCYDLDGLSIKRLSLSQLPPEELLELAELAKTGDEEQVAGII